MATGLRIEQLEFVWDTPSIQCCMHSNSFVLQMYCLPALLLVLLSYMVLNILEEKRPK